MAIIQIKPKKNEEQKFTELIEENKLRFYKTAKIILKNDDDVYDAICYTRSINKYIQKL